MADSDPAAEILKDIREELESKQRARLGNTAHVEVVDGGCRARAVWE